MLLGDAVMVNWSDVAVEHRRQAYEWHSREHMSLSVAIQGFGAVGAISPHMPPRFPGVLRSGEHRR